MANPFLQRLALDELNRALNDQDVVSHDPRADDDWVSPYINRGTEPETSYSRSLASVELHESPTVLPPRDDVRRHVDTEVEKDLEKEKEASVDETSRPHYTDEWVNATGDVVQGDTIRFKEAVFGGSFRRPHYLGERTITAYVAKDSYGDAKQQHTFTLDIVAVEGYDASSVLQRTTRKGRNVYRNGTERLRWKDEAQRDLIAAEKHQRGDLARRQRDERKNSSAHANEIERRLIKEFGKVDYIEDDGLGGFMRAIKSVYGSKQASAKIAIVTKGDRDRVKFEFMADPEARQEAARDGLTMDELWAKYEADILDAYYHLTGGEGGAAMEDESVPLEPTGEPSGETPPADEQAPADLEQSSKPVEASVDVVWDGDTTPKLQRTDVGKPSDIPLAAKTAETDNVRLWLDIMDAHRGELFGCVTAHAGKQLIGYVQFSYYDDIVRILYVEVAPAYRRKGIATAMYKRLKQEFPEASITSSGTTPEGGAFRKALVERGVLTASDNSDDIPTVTIPAGTKLYRGIGEPTIHPHGANLIEGVLWLTESKTFARTYIPTSPSSTFVSLKRLSHPPQRPNDSLVAIQRQLGIEFKNVKYDQSYELRSYDFPDIYMKLMADQSWPEEKNFAIKSEYYNAKHEWSKEGQRRLENYIVAKLRDMGYEPESKGLDRYYKLKYNHDDTIIPNEYVEGTLLTFEVTQPLRLYDFTEGGKREGDLTDLDYHKDFGAAKQAGFDGVKINDFAQTDIEGNVGHTSIGIFGRALPKVKEIGREATTHPQDLWGNVHKDGAASSEDPQAVCASAGAAFVALQNGLVWFNDPETGSTLALPLDNLNERTIQAKLRQSRAEFRSKEATMLSKLASASSKSVVEPLYKELFALRPQMAAAAQKVYDENVSANADDSDDEHGICDEIAREIAGVIVSNIDSVEVDDGGQEGDDHAWVIAYRGKEVYGIDIPYHVYETGGGYSWELKVGVRFEPDQVSIFPLDIDVADLHLAAASTYSDAWKTPRNEYAPYPRHPETGELDYENETSDQARERYRRRHEWDQSAVAALSTGRLTPEDAIAQKIDTDPPANKFKPLPSPLYHATTAASQVRSQGLKSRFEQNAENGRGLGGGDHKSISFTTDYSTVRGIYDSLLLSKQVLDGRLTPQRMLEMARKGKGAKTPWEADLVRWGGSFFNGEEEWRPGQPYGLALQMFLDGKKLVRWSDATKEERQKAIDAGATDGMFGTDRWPGYEPVGAGWDGATTHFYQLWARPLTPAEKREYTFDFFKTWLATREHNGGPENPLFFMTDVAALAAVPDKEIAILKCHPNPGAMGVQLGSLAEWRTFSGDAVTIDAVEQPASKVAVDAAAVQAPELSEEAFKANAEFPNLGTQGERRQHPQPWLRHGAAPEQAVFEFDPRLKSPAFRAWFQGSKVVDQHGQPLRVYHGTRSSEVFDEFSTEGRPLDESGEGYTTSGSGWDPTSYLGAHFAQEISVANRFAVPNRGDWMRSRYDGENEKPRVIPVYLSIKNPKNFGSERNLRRFCYSFSIIEYDLLDPAIAADGIDLEDDEKVNEWEQRYEKEPAFRTEQNEWLLERTSGNDSEELLNSAAQQLAGDAKEKLRSEGYDGICYRNEVEGGISWIAFDPGQIKSAIGNSGSYDAGQEGTTASVEVETELLNKLSAIQNGCHQRMAMPGGLLFRAPEKNLCHDYEPRWDYTIEEAPDPQLARLAAEVAKRIYQRTKQPFELWACRLNHDAIAVYIDGTSGFPVVLIDLEKHRGYEDQIGQSISHELKHAEQDLNGKSYDEDEAEHNN